MNKLAFFKTASLLMLIVSTSLSAAPLLQRESGNTETSNQGAINSEDNGQSNNALVNYELFKQLETLQMEVQELRGLLEEQNHQIDRIKKAERERYADLDKRITDLSASQNNKTNKISNDVGASVNEEQRTYNSAKAKKDAKEFNAAIAEFTLYLEFFPEGKYVAQANYWLGELYFTSEIPEYDNAKKHFARVIKIFPEHAKVPGCLYKLGLIQIAQNKKNEAKLTFQRLVNEHPKCSTSNLAKNQLKKL